MTIIHRPKSPAPLADAIGLQLRLHGATSITITIIAHRCAQKHRKAMPVPARTRPCRRERVDSRRRKRVGHGGGAAAAAVVGRGATVAAAAYILKVVDGGELLPLLEGAV